MPVVTGKEVLRQIRDQDLLPNIPIVLISERSEARQLVDRFACAGFMQKGLRKGLYEIARGEESGFGIERFISSSSSRNNHVENFFSRGAGRDTEADRQAQIDLSRFKTVDSIMEPTAPRQKQKGRYPLQDTGLLTIEDQKLHLEQHLFRIFYVLFHLTQETDRLTTVDNPMVVAQGEIHYRPDNNFTIPNHGAILHGMHP